MLVEAYSIDLDLQYLLAQLLSIASSICTHLLLLQPWYRVGRVYQRGRTPPPVDGPHPSETTATVKVEEKQQQYIYRSCELCCSKYTRPVSYAHAYAMCQQLLRSLLNQDWEQTVLADMPNTYMYYICNTSVKNVHIGGTFSRSLDSWSYIYMHNYYCVSNLGR